MVDNDVDTKILKIKEIFKKHKIKMSLWGCGCCGSPAVKFQYEGEVILEDGILGVEDIKFDMWEDDK